MKYQRATFSHRKVDGGIDIRHGTIIDKVTMVQGPACSLKVVYDVIEDDTGNARKVLSEEVIGYGEQLNEVRCRLKPHAIDALQSKVTELESF